MQRGLGRLAPVEAKEEESMKNENLFKLYLAMRSEHVEWISRQSEHFSHYLTLVVAILGLTTAAVYHLYDSEKCGLAVGAALLGFGANVGLCRAATSACDRFYRRFLESVTVMAKLEASLELDKRVPRAGHPFEDDQHWLPQRFYEDRDCHKTGESFVKARMREGVNCTVRAAMTLLAILNILMLVGAILVVHT